MKRIFNRSLFSASKTRALCSALLGASLFTSVPASAVLIINAPYPAKQYTWTDSGYGLYFATGDSTSVGSAGTGVGGAVGPSSTGHIVNTGLGFRVIDTAPSNGGIVYMDVMSNTTFSQPSGMTQPTLVVTLSSGTTTNSNEIPIQGASIMTDPNSTAAPSTCNSSGLSCFGKNGINYSAYYQQGQRMRIWFNLTDMCTYSNPTQGTGYICSGNQSQSPDDGSSYQQTIYATIGWVDVGVASGYVGPINTSGGQSPYQSTSGNEQASVQVYFTAAAPTITAPPSPTPVEAIYYPGDSEIFLNVNNLAPNTNSGAPIHSMMFFGSRNSLAETTISSGTMPSPEVNDQTVDLSGTKAEVTGFVNTDSFGAATTACPNGAPSNGYNASIYAMNEAGIVSDTPLQTPLTTGQGTVSCDGLFHAEPVNSVLANSKCFIATAAFHSGDAGPVKMLRRFRDHVLAKSQMGRDFIHTYYHYSPAVAEWAWDKPVIRSIALHALAPVEFIAWAWMEITHAAEVDTPQPYIDRVKKQLEKEDADKATKSDEDESYTEQVKKKLKPLPKEDESYTEKVKKKLPKEEDDTAGYTDRVKKDLPPEDEDEGSPIDNVKNGKDKRVAQKRPPIDSAFGLQFGISPGVKVSNPNSPISFDSMYGGGWQPDLVLHYEKQFLRSESWGSLAYGGDFGVTYAEGFGVYKYGFGSTDSTKSIVKFSFLQIPILADLIIRFNMLHVLRPYVGVGFGGIVGIEIASGSGSSPKNAELAYEGKAGAALLLNSADKTTSNQGFLSSGIQNTYFYLEFLAMRSLGSASAVSYQRNGLYGGFLFEM